MKPPSIALALEKVSKRTPLPRSDGEEDNADGLEEEESEGGHDAAREALKEAFVSRDPDEFINALHGYIKLCMQGDEEEEEEEY